MRGQGSEAQRRAFSGHRPLNPKGQDHSRPFVFSPRFQGENLQKNLDLVKKVQEIATERGFSASQLALAWVLAQGNDIVPIPGTKRRSYLEENLGAADVQLSPEDLQRIDEVAPRGAAAGTRYPEAMMAFVNN